MPIVNTLGAFREPTICPPSPGIFVVEVIVHSRSTHIGKPCVLCLGDKCELSIALERGDSLQILSREFPNAGDIRVFENTEPNADSGRIVRCLLVPVSPLCDDHFREAGVIAGPGHLVSGRSCKNPGDVAWAKANGFWFPDPIDWRCPLCGSMSIDGITKVHDCKPSTPHTPLPAASEE